MRRRKTRRLIMVCPVCQDERQIIQIVCDHAFINFALIGEKSTKGAYDNTITNSVKIGFRDINIACTHPFCTRKSKNPSEL